jgi:hypothetical protein
MDDQGAEHTDGETASFAQIGTPHLIGASPRTQQREYLVANRIALRQGSSNPIGQGPLARGFNNLARSEGREGAPMCASQQAAIRELS